MGRPWRKIYGFLLETLWGTKEHDTPKFGAVVEKNLLFFLETPWGTKERSAPKVGAAVEKNLFSLRPLGGLRIAVRPSVGGRRETVESHRNHITMDQAKEIQN